MTQIAYSTGHTFVEWGTEDRDCLVKFVHYSEWIDMQCQAPDVIVMTRAVRDSLITAPKFDHRPGSPPQLTGIPFEVYDTFEEAQQQSEVYRILGKRCLLLPSPDFE